MGPEPMIMTFLMSLRRGMGVAGWVQRNRSLARMCVVGVRLG
jgi:hypothetical protein